MRERRSGAGALVVGVILVLVGGYFLLRESLGIDIPEIDWDMVWPVAIIALGVAVLVGARSRRPAG